MTIRTRLLPVVLACAGLLAAAQVAKAQSDYPNRPIRLVVPHAAGGNSDAFGRILAGKLSERIGQQVVVENRTGAGGTIALAAVARSAPDGYTIAVADTGTHSIAPTLYGSRLQYDVFKDFTPITYASTFSTVLLLHPSVPANTTREFIELAKSKPGQLNYASAGTGNGSHLAQDLFFYAAGGLKLQHIPYKGGAPAVQAVLAGEVQMTAVSINTALPHVRSGKLKALAVASPNRASPLPDVPTLREAGITNADSDNWLAIVGPAGIPADVVRKLHAAIAESLNSPEIKERLAGLGQTVVAGDGAAFMTMLKDDEKKWGDTVKRSGATAN
jgi:tripartite-type tricarboxylate transporter receptor subunit TctC